MEHAQYFQNKEGRWQGDIHLQVTDRAKLRLSSMSSTEKQALVLLAKLSRAPFRPVLHTTIDCKRLKTERKVMHTTSVSILGMEVFRSREGFLLSTDGQSFQIQGAQQLVPFLRSAPFQASGCVSGDEDAAAYELPLFGIPIQQHTRMTSQGLAITQTTAFSRASILLTWRGLLDASVRARQTSNRSRA